MEAGGEEEEESGEVKASEVGAGEVREGRLMKVK